MFTTSKNVLKSYVVGGISLLLFLCITLLPEDVTWQVLTRSIGIFLANYMCLSPERAVRAENGLGDLGASPPLMPQSSLTVSDNA